MLWGVESGDGGQLWSGLSQNRLGGFHHSGIVPLFLLWS